MNVLSLKGSSSLIAIAILSAHLKSCVDMIRVFNRRVMSRVDLRILIKEILFD